MFVHTYPIGIMADNLFIGVMHILSEPLENINFKFKLNTYNKKKVILESRWMQLSAFNYTKKTMHFQWQSFFLCQLIKKTQNWNCWKKTCGEKWSHQITKVFSKKDFFFERNPKYTLLNACVLIFNYSKYRPHGHDSLYIFVTTRRQILNLFNQTRFN